MINITDMNSALINRIKLIKDLLRVIKLSFFFKSLNFQLQFWINFGV